MENTIIQNKERSLLANIRQRRDKALGNIQTALFVAYGYISFVLLGMGEAKGDDVTIAAIWVYGSYLVITAIGVVVAIDSQGLADTLIKSFRSVLALALVLVITFPIRVFLGGISSYKRYALREVKRIVKIEMSRWKERF